MATFITFLLRKQGWFQGQIKLFITSIWARFVHLVHDWLRYFPFVSTSLLWPMCAAPTDTSFYFFILISNYIFTKTVNKFNLILFLSLLMVNHLKTTSVDLYFPPGKCLFVIFVYCFFSNFCNIFLVNKFDWLNSAAGGGKNWKMQVKVKKYKRAREARRNCIINLIKLLKIASFWVIDS